MLVLHSLLFFLRLDHTYDAVEPLLAKKGNTLGVDRAILWKEAGSLSDLVWLKLYPAIQDFSVREV